MTKCKFSKFCNVINIKNQQKFSIIKIDFRHVYLKFSSLLLKKGFIRGFFLSSYNNTRVIYLLLKHMNDKIFFRLKKFKKVNSDYKSNLNFLILSAKKDLFLNTNTSSKMIGLNPLIHVDLL